MFGGGVKRTFSRPLLNADSRSAGGAAVLDYARRKGKEIEEEMIKFFGRILENRIGKKLLQNSGPSNRYFLLVLQTFEVACEWRCSKWDT